MSGYSAGSVSAKIVLDTKEFKKSIQDLKQQMNTLKSNFKDVQMETVAKDVDTLKKAIKALKQEESKLSENTKKIDKSLKNTQTSLDATAQSLKRETEALKTQGQAAKETINANKQITEAATQTSKALEKSTNENIKNKQKEAQQFKKYTLEEISILEDLNRWFGYSLEKGKTKVPIDNKYGMTSYSKLLRKFRNDTQGLTGVWDKYLNDETNDYSKHFQNRWKDMLGDLGVYASNEIDNEYKKVRDKSTGKMVEYLDISQLKDNEKWLEKTRKQMQELSAFKRSIGKYSGSWSNSKYDRRKLKDVMDIYSNLDYEQYGKGGNPYIKDFLKNTREGEYYVNKYKQAQRDLNDAFYSAEYQIAPASKALDTFNRMLKTTSVEAIHTKRELTETGKALQKNMQLRAESGKRGMLGTGNKPQGIKASMQLEGKNAEALGFALGRKILHNYLKEVSQAKIQVKRDATEIANAISKFAGFKTTGKTTAFKEWQLDLQQLSSQIKKVGQEYNIFTKNTSASIKTFMNLGNYVEQFRTKFELLHTGFNKITQSIVKTTDVLKAFNFALLEGVDKETIFYQRTVQLASAMQRLYTQGSRDWKFDKESNKWLQTNSMISGTGNQFGYAGYVNQINEVDKALGRQKTTYADIHGSQTKFAQGNERSVSSLRRLTGELNSSGSSTNTLRRGMQYVDKDALRARYSVDSFGKGVRVAGNYTRITSEDFDKMSKNLKNTEKGMTQSAHSGRILSNTLYQIRGALLSLKMIFTAMGGMMIWDFGMQLAEGVKQTITAKNEMEAQLRQNSKVSEGGIEYFNKQLDEMTDKFQKINKYSIGETVSAIGLEFNLNAKQMAESLDVVSMIQSEYVRAGRKEDEAALAVKDILQGEFQRLSRETGVGKEELLNYGWNGDKTDVEGLMKALRKAALDRHWDIFAKKATSLNDVMTILKSRFSETSADFVQSITPAIVEGFNMLIGAVEGVQKAFNGLNPFLQNGLLVGGFMTLATTIGTAIPMITKGMGLADIATIGWSKSLATAALNLNKTTVAQYGFRKALAEVITGTKASDLANVRSTKAIMGRLLGVKQSVLAEKGYMTALVHSKGILKNHTGATNVAKISSMGFAQKLAYLTNNMKLQNAQNLSTSKAILKTATSFKVLKMAILGVTAISLTAWFAGVAANAAKVKANIDAFNEIRETGYDKLDDAKKDLETYSEQMSKYEEGSEKYNKAKANHEIVKGNIAELETATQLVGSYKLQNEEREKNIKLASEQFRKNNLIAAGNDPAAASEKAAGWTNKIEEAQKSITNSYDQQYNFLEASSKHISANVGNLKEAGASQEQLNKYIYEYSAVAEEAGEHLKQFYQGDLQAGAYYLWDRIRLTWIDISNHPEVVKLMNNLSKTWESWQPTLKAIAKFLSDIGLKLVDLANAFLSTDFGQQTALWATLAGAVGLVGWKFKGTIGSVKDVLGKFKTLGGKLKDLAGKWKDVADKAEDANEKMGGKDKDKNKGKDKDKDVPSTSTGGINGDTPTSKGELGKALKGDFFNNIRSFADNAAKLASAMLLVSEAILLLNAPMGALAATGVVFKALEPQIRDGIEGLKLIAPTIAIFLPPVIALMLITNQFGKAFDVKSSFVQSVEVIAAGLLLVGEAVLMMAAPMIGIAALGGLKSLLGDSIEQGKQAIKLTTDTLVSLYPIIPVFAAALVMGVIAVGTGGAGFVAEATVIASGMLLVGEAVLMMAAPLAAIAAIGAMTTDIDGVKRGAEAIKVTAEALKYVEEGMRSLTLISWELLADYVAQLVGKVLHIDLSSLTGEGGVFQQLEKFAQEFAKVNITPIDTAKAETLKTVAANIDTVSEALKTVKDAAAKLPKFGQEMSNNFGNGLGDAAMQGAEAETTDTASFFEQIKKPIEDLNTFVTDFNNMAVTPPDTSKVEAINQASSMITQVKSAVDNLNATLGGAVDAGWNANMASGGIGAAVSGFVFGLGGGTGEYSSSLGTSLSQMYNAIKDIMTFTQKVNGLTGGGEGGNASVTAAVDMVTAVDNAIQNLQNTLSTAAPNVKSSALAIGTGIKDGVKEGLNGLDTDIITKVAAAISAAKPTAHTYGQGLGDQGKQGVQQGFKIKDAISTELGYALTEMENKKQEFYDKGYALGKASADGFKAGEDSHSPGIIARTMFAEMGYVSQSLDDAIATVPQKAYALGNALATNFTPQFATDFGLTDMSAFETGLQGITTAANDTNLQTSMAFQNMNLTANTSMTGMTNSINGAFSNIQQSTTSRYSQLVSTTRVSLNSMQSQTTKNINAIKTSWRGMQNALIQSAENIRSETGAKIKSLENNMASFWSKVQNPSTLMASAAGPINGSGTIRRRSTPTSIRRTSSRKGTSKRTYAAGPFKTGKKYTGITTSFNNSGSKSYGLRIRNLLAEYLQCLSDGGNCAMGSGWSFNWTKDIQDALMTWHTHFGEIYDDKLRVGSFENDDFPVRGDADIFKKYVYDAISRTQYQGYFNSKCGDDPIAAYESGHFNCWDGSNIVMRLASAFGFSSHRVWGSWDGIPHVWAHVDGVGDIDATAIQGGYGLFASKVRAAGPLKVRNSSKGDATGFGDTHNYGDVNVTINVYGDDVEVNENKVDKSTAKQIIDILGVNPATGQ